MSKQNRSVAMPSTSTNETPRVSPLKIAGGVTSRQAKHTGAATTVTAASRQGTHAHALRSANEAQMSQKAAAQKPLKNVGMRFYARVGDVLRELWKHARAARGRQNGRGSFTLMVGGRELKGVVQYHGVGDKLVSEPSFIVYLGDFVLSLPEKDAGAQYQRLTVHADVSLCYGRTIGEVLVHMTNFVDSMVEEIATGELYWTYPKMVLPVFDEENPHVEPAMVPRELKTETTPRYVFSRDFARWLGTKADPTKPGTFTG